MNEFLVKTDFELLLNPKDPASHVGSQAKKCTTLRKGDTILFDPSTYEYSYKDIEGQDGRLVGAIKRGWIARD